MTSPFDDTKPLTPAQLDEIRARLCAATPITYGYGIPWFNLAINAPNDITALLATVEQLERRLEAARTAFCDITQVPLSGMDYASAWIEGLRIAHGFIATYDEARKEAP